MTGVARNSRRHSAYDSPRLAAGYASHRPPVHPHVIAALARHLEGELPMAVALDVGCGAGLSTRALAGIAHCGVGMEPALAMLAHAHAVAPESRFVAGAAEALPFPPATFALITAAGAIDYADAARFLAEASRVLRPGGALAIYNFSPGRRLRRSVALEEWWALFARRYPSAGSRLFDVRALDFAAQGLRLEHYEEMEISIGMTRAAYVRYVMSEGRIEAAIANGTEELEIRHWCEESLPSVMDDAPEDVLFDAYLAVARTRIT